MTLRLWANCGWSALRREGWVVTTPTLSPSKPEIFTIWPLTEEICQFYSVISYPISTGEHLLSLIVLELPSHCRRCHVLNSFLLPWALGAQALRLRLPGALYEQGSVERLRFKTLKVKISPPPNRPVSGSYIVVHDTTPAPYSSTEIAGLEIPGPGLKFQLSGPFLNCKNNDHHGVTS